MLVDQHCDGERRQCVAHFDNSYCDLYRFFHDPNRCDAGWYLVQL
jgi:hypothetical protein